MIYIIGVGACLCLAGFFTGFSLGLSKGTEIKSNADAWMYYNVRKENARLMYRHAQMRGRN